MIGTLLFVLFLTKQITSIVTAMDPTDVGRQIANAHTIFNISNVIIQFPFAFVLIKIAMWIVPETDEKSEEKLTRYIDDRILETPTIAMKSVINETINMGNIANDSLTYAMTGLLENQPSKAQQTFILEKKINILERLITDYLVKLSNKDINESDRKYIDGLFNSVNDIERIGDHADNIAELVVTMNDDHIVFSDDSKKSLALMYQKTQRTFELALEVMDNPARESINEVIALEAEMDCLQKEARKAHFARLYSNECSSESGVYYLEIINNLERISDLSNNLVHVVSDTAEVA